jgi:hypothetical protein
MKHTLLLVILQLASAGADGYYTHRNLVLPHFREINPLERPFVRSTPEFVAASALSTAGVLYGEYWLHRRGHENWWLAAADAGSHAWGAAYSATHTRPVVRP